MGRTQRWWQGCVALLVVAGGLATAAQAQFQGPAPLAWRWAESASVPPAGRPVVSGDVIYVAVGSRIYAVNRVNGNQEWRFPVGVPLEANFRTGLTDAGDIVVAATDDGTVYGVNKDSGELAFQYSSPDPVIGRPAVTSSAVVFQLPNNRLMAIDFNGNPLWDNPFQSQDGLFAAMVGSGNSVYFFTNRLTMNSLNVNTQQLNWSQRFNRLQPTVEAALFEDTLYITSGTFVIALRTTNGTARWQADTRANLIFGPAANENGLAVVSDRGAVFLFNSGDGRPLFGRGIELNSIPIASPSMLGRFAAVVTSNGALNVIDPQTGDIVWNFTTPPVTTVRSDQPAGAGGPAGGAPGAGMGGPGGLGGMGEGLGGGGQTGGSSGTAPTFVQAAGSPVLAGSTVLLLARDGSLLAFDPQNGVDLTPPTVQMLWPRRGEEFNGNNVELLFFLRDEGTGINPDTVRALIDGVAYEIDLQRNGLLSVRISNRAGSNRPLTNGRRTITVVAEDWMGNRVEQEFSVVIDNTLPAAGAPQLGGQGNQGGGGAPGMGGPGRGPGRG